MKVFWYTKSLRLDSLEDLVIMSKNIFGCDRDHLFLAWVTAEAKNPDKIEEIWIQIQVKIVFQFMPNERLNFGEVFL